MLNTIPGYISQEECDLLGTIFSKYNYEGAVGVEIGSFLGRSAYSISKAIPNGTLYCIDPWDEWEVSLYGPPGNIECRPVQGTKSILDNFLENTKDCSNIVPIRGISPKIVRGWVTDVDFVFLDALHRNPNDIMSIIFWLPKIKPTGIFAGHDYYPDDLSIYPDVISNVRYLEKKLNKSVIFPGIGSTWYFNI